jgi:hypothetical protein
MFLRDGSMERLCAFAFYNLQAITNYRLVADGSPVAVGRMAR